MSVGSTKHVYEVSSTKSLTDRDILLVHSVQKLHSLQLLYPLCQASHDHNAKSVLPEPMTKLTE